VRAVDLGLGRAPRGVPLCFNKQVSAGKWTRSCKSSVEAEPFRDECVHRADQINHQTGNPVDQAIGSGIDFVVSSPGTVLEDDSDATRHLPCCVLT
jgi:hypothetical protein